MIKLSILGREIVLSSSSDYSGKVVYYVAEITPVEFKLLSNKQSPEGYFTSVMAILNGSDEGSGYFEYWVMARNYNTGDTVQIRVDMRACNARSRKYNQIGLFTNEVESAQPDLFN